MIQNKNKRKRAFTIIEVVLVLALAGLIFLMIFVVLPPLQRGQRNTRRRQDMARIMSAFEEYKANNGSMPYYQEGNYAIIKANFIRKYIDSEVPEREDIERRNHAILTCGDQFKDPSGTCYFLYNNGAETFYTDTSYAIPIENDKYNEEAFSDKNYVIHLFPNGKCDTEGVINKAGGLEQFALVYILEGGSVYCIDNQ